jgi:hypothetical protein
VTACDRPETVRGEELVLRQHGGENPPQTLRTDDGEQPALVLAQPVGVGDVGGEAGLVGEEPCEATGEVRKPFEGGPAERGGGAERQQAHHGADPKRDAVTASDLENVVVEAVLLVPEPLLVDGRRDEGDVLEEPWS